MRIWPRAKRRLHNLLGGPSWSRVVRFPLAALLAALILLPPLATMPAEAQGSRVWSVASEARLVDATRVTETRSVTYDARHYSSQWAIHVPPNATFREARDASGPLSARVDGGEVEVTTRGRGVSAYTFSVVFDLAPRQEGPFTGFMVSIGGDYDSPTSLRLVLPAGWTLPGWYAGSGLTPDEDGVFRRVGGQVVDFLALPPDAKDPGPDPRVEGHGVRRDGEARLAATGGFLNLTYTYDTDVYSPVWKVPLGQGVTLLGASSPFGPIPASASGGVVQVTAPYKAGYHLGGRSFTLSLGLPAPEQFGGEYLQANVSVAAAQGDNVSLRISLAPDLVHVGDDGRGVERVGNLSYVGEGPMRVRVAFLPPLPPGQVRFHEGAYVVQAPRALEAAARATAANASELLPRVAGFLGGANLSRPFTVVYTHADVFGWEEGYYTYGLDAISIRASDLANATDGRPRLVPVSTLVHETAHGLVDRLFADPPDDLSLLHEGLARLAETHVEAFFPHEVVQCSTQGVSTRCQRLSARPELDRLQPFLRSGAPFDATWSADAIAADARGFAYDYSGLVFHAYEMLAGGDTLRHAVADLADDAYEGATAAENADHLAATLLRWAPGLSRDGLLHPGRQVAHLPEAEFRACMGDLLPPRYPFEPEARMPSGGCGWPDVTPLPPPPSDGSDETPEPPAPPVPATPKPRVPTVNTSEPAPGETPLPPTPIPDDPDDPIVRAGEPDAAPPGSAPVPLPAPALVVLLAGLLALATRSRRARQR